MANLSEQDLYRIYQQNLLMCEIQINLIKDRTLEVLSELSWKKVNAPQDSRIPNLEKKLIAAERLYIFMIANWFELRLFKIIYENSSAGFRRAERERIFQKRKIEEKWSESFKISFEKISPKDTKQTISLDDIKSIFTSIYIKEIGMVITARNRLAHGQWDIQLNANNTNRATPDLLAINLNSMQITELHTKLKIIAEFLEIFVVYKEKNDDKFQQKIQQKISKIKNIDSRIENKDYDKYVKQAIRRFENHRKHT